MKTPQTNDSLAKAVACLGAKEVAPGRYAHCSRSKKMQTGLWMVSPTDAMIRFAQYLATLPVCGEQVIAYQYLTRDSAWMPAWWSPEQRFAWRARHDGGYWLPERYRTKAEAKKAELIGAELQRITADLTTGEEVPA